MPSAATITAFYNFSANTKARASQVTNNFDVFRGHIIPVHVSTATSANNTYDLGSSEYRWRNGYIKNLNLGETTASWDIVDSAASGGDLLIRKNGVEKFRIDSTGIFVPYALGSTASAGPGQIGLSTTTTAGAITLTPAGVFYTISSAALTIQTTGKPVFIQLIGSTSNAAATGFEPASSTAGSAFIWLQIQRGSSRLYGHAMRVNNTLTRRDLLTNPIWIDTPPAGTYTYRVGAFTEAGATGCSITFDNFNIFAKEIF